MQMTVRFWARLSMAVWTSASAWASKAAVASSSTNMGALRMKARAMAIRWRCPPESAAPRSPQLGFESFVQFFDEFGGVGLLGGLEDFFFCGVGSSAADVFGDGLVEDDYVLADEGEQFAVVFDFELAQVFSVEEDGACGRVKEAEEEVDESGFAGAAFAGNA